MEGNRMYNIKITEEAVQDIVSTMNTKKINDIISAVVRPHSDTSDLLEIQYIKDDAIDVSTISIILDKQ